MTTKNKLQNKFIHDLLDFAIYGIKNYQSDNPDDFWDIFMNMMCQISLKYNDLGEYATWKIVQVVRDIEVRFEKHWEIKAV